MPGRFLTQGVNIFATAQGIFDSMLNGYEEEGLTRSGVSTDISGSYFWTYSLGSSEESFDEITTIPIVTDALAAMREAGRGAINFSIMDALGRMHFAVGIVFLGD